MHDHYCLCFSYCVLGLVGSLLNISGPEDDDEFYARMGYGSDIEEFLDDLDD